MNQASEEFTCIDINANIQVPFFSKTLVISVYCNLKVTLSQVLICLLRATEHHYDYDTMCLTTV